MVSQRRNHRLDSCETRALHFALVDVVWRTFMLKNTRTKPDQRDLRHHHLTQASHLRVGKNFKSQLHCTCLQLSQGQISRTTVFWLPAQVLNRSLNLTRKTFLFPSLHLLPSSEATVKHLLILPPLQSFDPYKIVLITRTSLSLRRTAHQVGRNLHRSQPQALAPEVT